MRKCKICNKDYDDSTKNCPVCGQNLNYPEGNKFCWFAIGCYILSFIVDIMSGGINSLYRLLCMFILPPAQIGIILSIIGYCKYKENKFVEAMFIISMAAALLAVIAIILFIKECNSCFTQG